MRHLANWLIAVMFLGAGAGTAFAAPPYHGSLDGLAYGASGELRFAEDRTDGASNPDWFSFGEAAGFLFVHASSRLDLAGQGRWERVADD
jgi:hypothetical protein